MNIKYYITTIIIISSLNLFSQDLLEGQIIDGTSKRPLAWVNIGIVGKNIGTVSNNEGNFKIEISEKYNQDTLRISMIGYKEQLFMVNEFKDRVHKNTLLELEVEVTQLDEIIISSNKSQDYILGNKTFTNTTVYGFQSNELGNELGTIIRIEDGPVLIKKVNINIYKNPIKVFKFRLNIYNLKDAFPDKNILSENIIIECKKNRGTFVVDVSKYAIVVDEDIFVSMEWIENSKERELYFSTTPDGSKTFSRYTSQATWFEEPNVSLGLNIIVKY